MQFGSDLSLDNLEAILDKHSRQLQEMRETGSRSFQLSPKLAAYADDVLVPTPEAGKVWTWNADLQVEFVNITTLRYGTTVPSTDLGNDGDFYLDTVSELIYGPKSGLDWGSPASIQGPQGIAGPTGPTGATGRTILSGAGAPAGGLGDDGDFYLNTSAYSLYGPKASGSWGSPTSLVGPVGAGSGDVVGPAGASDGDFAVFDGSTGKLLKAAASPPGDVFGPATNTDANLATFDGDDSKTIQDSGIAAADVLLASDIGDGVGDVVGPASATDAAIALFDTTTGKLLKDSGKTTANIGAGKQTIWVPASAMVCRARRMVHRAGSVETTTNKIMFSRRLISMRALRNTRNSAVKHAQELG